MLFLANPLRLFAFFLIILAGLVACSENEGTTGADDGTTLDTIRIAPWGPKLIDFIDFYVGEENGYFTEAGIRIEQLAAEGAGDAVRNVVAGNADIAMADPFSAYFAIQRGAEISGIYCPYPKSWMKLVVNSKHGIKNAADLKGKTLAVTSQASTSRYYAMFFLAANGLTEDDLTIASVGRDFATTLLGGSVDAASTWDSINWALFQKAGGAEEHGFEIWEYEQVPGPNDVYFVQTKWLQENKELIQRFINAIQKSKLWIAENPEKAAEIGSRHAIGSDDLVRNRAIIDLRINMQSNGPGVAENGMGWCDIDAMTKVTDQAVEIGIIEKKLDLTNIITNEFIK